MIEKPEIVKYKVTGPFGNCPKGKVINAILITKDRDTGKGIIYHPKSEENGCGTFGYCRLDGDIWVDVDSKIYVNVNYDNTTEFEGQLFGANFEFDTEIKKEETWEEHYSDYGWIKVKRYENDPDKDWEGKYKSLMFHHEKETMFMIKEIRRLAELLDDYGVPCNE